MIKKSTLEKIVNEDLAAIWTILTPEEKHIVANNFNVHTFSKNQIIYAEKDEPIYLWCLLKGKVKLFKDGIGGRQQILRLYRPIQYFGYRAYFAEEPYVSSAAAFEPSTVGTIPMQVVKEIIDSNTGLAWFFSCRGTHGAHRQLRLRRRRRDAQDLHGSRRPGQPVEHDNKQCHTHPVDICPKENHHCRRPPH